VTKPNPRIEVLKRTDLRKWCIEQAIRWPTTNGNYGVMSQGGGTRTEADLIGNAKKIETYITGSDR
jgi:hypothetical protein